MTNTIMSIDQAKGSELELLVRSLAVKCPDCEYRGTLAAYVDHEKTCSGGSVSCSACQKSFKENLLEAHSRICLSQEVTCPFECQEDGDRPLLRMSLNYHLDQSCQHRPVPCLVQGCDFSTGRRGEMAVHRQMNRNSHASLQRRAQADQVLHIIRGNAALPKPVAPYFVMDAHLNPDGDDTSQRLAMETTTANVPSCAVPYPP